MINTILSWFSTESPNVEPFYRAREVWSYAQVDPKTRRSVELPILVFRKAEGGMFWGLLLTNVGTTKRPHYVPRRVSGKKVSALSQMRTLRADRLSRKLGVASEKEFGVLTSSVVRVLAATLPAKKAPRPQVVRAPQRHVLSPFTPFYALPARV